MTSQEVIKYFAGFTAELGRYTAKRIINYIESRRFGKIGIVAYSVIQPNKPISTQSYKCVIHHALSRPDYELKRDKRLGVTLEYANEKYSLMIIPHHSSEELMFSDSDEDYKHSYVYEGIEAITIDIMPLTQSRNPVVNTLFILLKITEDIVDLLEFANTKIFLRIYMDKKDRMNKVVETIKELGLNAYVTRDLNDTFIRCDIGLRGLVKAYAIDETLFGSLFRKIRNAILIRRPS